MLRRVACSFSSRFTSPSILAPISRGLKETTGVVGLDVDPNARQTLIDHLNEIKEMIAEKIPEGVEYRKSVERTVEYKLKQIAENESDEGLEKVLGCQLEQEIQVCKDELGLIPKMQEWKPWEVPEGHKVPIYYGDDPEDSGYWNEMDNKPLVGPEAPPGKV